MVEPHSHLNEAIKMVMQKNILQRPKLVFTRCYTMEKESHNMIYAYYISHSMILKYFSIMFELIFVLVFKNTSVWLHLGHVDSGYSWVVRLPTFWVCLLVGFLV